MGPSPVFLAALLLLLPLAGAGMVWLPLLSVRQPGAAGGSGAGVAARAQELITIGISVLSVVLILAIAATVREPLPFEFAFIGMYLDSLSIYFILLVSIVAVIASFYAGPWWCRRSGANGMSRTVFYTLFNLFHFTMVLVPMVSNLVILWIGIELTTVTSTALVAAERTRRHFEAAWKYIIITSTGIIFALLGTLFLTKAVLEESLGSVREWHKLMGIASELDDNLVRLSFLFILIGYGAKAGLAPMHTWLPDAHGEAPYPVSALLSGVLLKSALYVILRFQTITNAALESAGFTSAVLLSVGLLSLVAATPLILKGNPFKRILAYHSLEHMGIITVGIGIGGPIALFGALLHVLNHGVTKSLMFLAYGNVQDNFPEQPQESAPRSTGAPGNTTQVDDHRGVLKAMPWTGSVLALGGLALVGTPPFSIFISQLLILWGGIAKVINESAEWLVIPIVIFLGSVTLIFGGLLRHLSRMLLGPPPTNVQPESVRQILPLLCLFLLVVLLGLVIPDGGVLDLRRLLNESVAIVCGGGCSL